MLKSWIFTFDLRSNQLTSKLIMQERGIMDINNFPEQMVFGLDIGTRSIVGTVGYKKNERNFIVIAHTAKYHETRAMLDGQIHDIAKVTETIIEVKRDLEKQINRKLTEVCIAAAGRVLKTVTTKAEIDLVDERIVTEEDVHALELTGIEKGYEQIREETKEEGINFYCVGYSVIHYYLNGYMFTNLNGHKGSKLAAEVLATFLPEEVIEGLYTAVGNAGLQVANLTLEPIAAINVAIPEQFRLLNIALVDVGAGTSDICITKDGSIIAYGMISMAGDAITDTIAKTYLVDFKTAETIKTASIKKKSITYKDILGLSHKITPAEVLETTKDTVEKITKEIASRIIELNGGKSVSAVFVVGGGGKISSFTTALANFLELPSERVALRGEEVLGEVEFLDSKIKKDPLLVTPIGICLNYYEQKNNFIFVQVNGEQVKLYDNSKLTVVDAAIGVGYPNETLFPRRGKAIHFSLNGNKRMIRGEVGEAAEITLNGKVVGMNAPISQNDIILIKESTAGADAVYEVQKLPEYHGTISFIVNDKEVKCPKFILANNKLVSEYYSIKDGDELEILGYYTLEQLLGFLDLPYIDGILVNNVIASGSEKVYENFRITYAWAKGEDTDYYESTQDLEEAVETTEDKIKDTTNYITKDTANDTTSAKLTENPASIYININGSIVTLKGKSSYILVDILDVYSFDLSVARGNKVVIKCNGEDAEFTTKIKDGDFIELFWEN